MVIGPAHWTLNYKVLTTSNSSSISSGFVTEPLNSFGSSPIILLKLGEIGWLSFAAISTETVASATKLGSDFLFSCTMIF